MKALAEFIMSLLAVAVLVYGFGALVGLAAHGFSAVY